MKNQKIELKVDARDAKSRTRVMRAVARCEGVYSVQLSRPKDMKKETFKFLKRNDDMMKLTVIGDGMDAVQMAVNLRKICETKIRKVGGTKLTSIEEEEIKDKGKDGGGSGTGNGGGKENDKGGGGGTGNGGGKENDRGGGGGTGNGEGKENDSSSRGDFFFDVGDYNNWANNAWRVHQLMLLIMLSFFVDAKSYLGRTKPAEPCMAAAAADPFAYNTMISAVECC